MQRGRLILDQTVSFIHVTKLIKLIQSRRCLFCLTMQVVSAAIQRHSPLGGMTFHPSRSTGRRSTIVSLHSRYVTFREIGVFLLMVEYVSVIACFCFRGVGLSFLLDQFTRSIKSSLWVLRLSCRSINYILYVCFDSGI